MRPGWLGSPTRLLLKESNSLYILSSFALDCCQMRKDLKTSVQFLASVNISFNLFHLSLLKAFFLKLLVIFDLPDHPHIWEPHHVIQYIVKETTYSCKQCQTFDYHPVFFSLSTHQIGYIFEFIYESKEFKHLPCTWYVLDDLPPHFYAQYLIFTISINIKTILLYSFSEFLRVFHGLYIEINWVLNQCTDLISTLTAAHDLWKLHSFIGHDIT